MTPNADQKGSATLEELEARLQRQDEKLAEQQRLLEAQQQKLKDYEDKLNRLLGERAVQPGLEHERGAGIVQAPPAGASSPSVGDNTVAQAQPEKPPAPAAPVGQAPQAETRPPAIAPLTDAQSVLTPRGKFTLEPSLQYLYSSNSRVQLVGFTIIPAITIGLIDIQRVNRTLWSAALTGRWGVTDRFEVEAKVPWIYRTDSTLARPLATAAVADQVFNATGDGLGDVEVAARYQLTRRSPFTVGFLRYKTTTGKGPFDVPTTTPVTGLTIPTRLPTGTGFPSLQIGGTALVPSDPAVLFGGLSYIWNMQRHVKGSINTVDANGAPITVPIGEIDPGDGVNFNFGLGLGINERSSFSIGYDQTVFFRDKLNGQTVTNAQTQTLGTLLFGFSYKLSPRTNFNLTLGAGLTRDAPDVQIFARVPYTF